jgi:hypothetical protein
MQIIVIRQKHLRQMRKQKVYAWLTQACTQNTLKIVCAGHKLRKLG